MKDVAETLKSIRLSINPLRIIGIVVCCVIAIIAKKSKKLEKVRKPLMVISAIAGIVLAAFELESNFKPVDETELEFEEEFLDDED